MVVADFIVTIHAGGAGTAVEQVRGAAADTRAEAATVALSKNRDKAGIAATHGPLFVQVIDTRTMRCERFVARAPRVPWELVHPSTAERTK